MEAEMPLRDHFRPPLDDLHSWDALHGAWPTMIVQYLNSRLPSQYIAAPSIHLGSQIEVDAATFDRENPSLPFVEHSTGWQLSAPSLVVETELLKVDDYEVKIYDAKHHRRLVAAIEIVSPSNKDRPESRRVFVAKCRELLRQGVSVAIVDVVTDRDFNLYTELLDLIGQSDPAFEPEPPAIYAAACRWIPRGRKHILETWSHRLHLGQVLPTIPLWLTEQFAVPLDLESTYEDACRVLRIE
jgi:hypothetical protein